MKNFLTTEWEKVCAISSGADLHRLFFRAVQVFSLLGFIYFLLCVLPMYSLPEFIGMGISISPAWIFPALLPMVFQLTVAEVGLRAVAKKRFLGTILGLILSVVSLPSWWFVFGFFGFYCFLNEDFQKTYLSDAPAGFLRFLDSMNILFVPLIDLRVIKDIT